MINVWDTDLNLPMICLSADILFKQRIGLFIFNHLSISFTNYTMDNQQGCFRLRNLSSLFGS